MRLLISNDDGIYSPGIRALAKAAGFFGEVRIVAPDVEQSSTGHAITHSRPLTYKKTAIEGFEAFRVNGTPADCVALGLHGWGKADVVLSGINLGLNVGNSTWHSGTLAAARQASLLDMKGIAFSTAASEEPDFTRLEGWVRKVLDLLLPDESLDLVNVNIPPDPVGIRWTRQSVQHYDGKVIPATDPQGRQFYWISVVPMESPEPGTDRWALEHSYVSITPLRLDLTDDEGLRRASGAPRSAG